MMADTEVVEIDKDEFMALEECLEAAERLSASTTGQQATSIQGKRHFGTTACGQAAPHLPVARMLCTAALQETPLDLQQQQQKPAQAAGGMWQQQARRMVGFRAEANCHSSRFCNSSAHVSQQPAGYQVGDGMQLQQQGYQDRRQQQQHLLHQHSADTLKCNPLQQHNLQGTAHSLPVPIAGCWSGGSLTSSLNRQQSATHLDSRLDAKRQCQQQQQLCSPLPHQQQGGQQCSPAHQVPLQQQGGCQLQQGHHWQGRSSSAMQQAGGVMTAGDVMTASSVTATSVNGGGRCATNFAGEAAGSWMHTAGSCISASIAGVGMYCKNIHQHSCGVRVDPSKAAAECSGSQGQAAAAHCGGCVTGVVNPQAAAAAVRPSCTGPGCGPAVPGNSVLPGATLAGSSTGSGSCSAGAVSRSSTPVAHLLANGTQAQCVPSGAARDVSSSSSSGAGTIWPLGKEAGISGKSSVRGGGVAASGTGSGSSSRRLPASLSNSSNMTVMARRQQGRQGPAARAQLPHQPQQQQQQVGPLKPLQLEYHGQVRYAYQPHEVDWLCQQLLDAGPPGVVGFDLEWRPTYKKGCAPNKAALLQLAYAVDKRGKDWRPKPDGKGVMVLLLQVLYSGITPQLQIILSREDIVKVGVNISGDANKLLADFNVRVESLCELSDVANGRQLSCVDGITSNIENKRWSLAGLVEEVLSVQLPKPNDIRCGNWEKIPLEKEQQRYAAMDAFACLLLHWEMQDLPERLTLSQQLRQGMMERAAAAAIHEIDDH